MVYRDNASKYWLILVIVAVILTSGATLWISSLYRQLEVQARKISQTIEERANLAVTINEQKDALVRANNTITDLQEANKHLEWINTQASTKIALSPQPTITPSSTNNGPITKIAGAGLLNHPVVYAVLLLFSLAGLGSGLVQKLRRKSEREEWIHKICELERKLQTTTIRINQMQMSYRAAIWSENAKSKYLECQLRETAPD